MANYKRRKPRTAKTKGQSGGMWLEHWPRSWDLINHTRPKRRASKRVVNSLMSGKVDVDEVTFPVSQNKPHEYYW